MNIILIGMPGCGKSTVGALLAEMTGRTLIDTDALIVENEGRDIPTIFAADGENYFRRAEHKAISDAAKQSSRVISTGGGAVTREENYRSLKQNGTIIYIDRDISELSREGRPLSQSTDLSEMYNRRRPMYLAVADPIVKNDQTPLECAEKILDIIRKG